RFRPPSTRRVPSTKLFKLSLGLVGKGATTCWLSRQAAIPGGRWRHSTLQTSTDELASCQHRMCATREEYLCTDWGRF
ncbi:MAG: hypothetical protein AB7I50_23545, partial [Vicinamibacterales bacterium]